MSRLRSEGEASFHESRQGPRRVSVMVGETAEKANRLLASGMSGAAVARELGLAKATVNYCRRKGFIGSGPPYNPGSGSLKLAFNSACQTQISRELRYESRLC